ncbi:haloacid dehalogenase type II [Solicola sp. PLA-1-18]|uniref:haloacid dehalogenase type II n=1 Tax=Solicola sp. PLA-1-18 TaxID=3380532 RepID=UPI003B7F19A7
MTPSTSSSTPSVAWVLLDVNQTLSDTGPLAHAFESVGAPGHLAEHWFTTVLRDGFGLSSTGTPSPFGDVARGCLQVELSQVLVDADVEEAVDEVMTALGGLDPHPDVAPGVRALTARGLRVATLGNGAASTARSLLEKAGLDGDVAPLLSVDDAGAWKPAPQAYAYALSVLDAAAGDVLMVAVHPWDLEGARRVGLRTAWVNRDGRTWPPHMAPPDLVVTRLDELHDRLSS